MPGSVKVAPFLLVGDDDFPLKRYLMKPYPGKFLAENNNIYNYRVSRARHCVENAFGISAVRWQIFYGMIRCHPELAEKLVRAAVVLHNVLQLESFDLGDKCMPDGQITNGQWRQSIPSCTNLVSHISDARAVER